MTAETKAADAKAAAASSDVRRQRVQAARARSAVGQRARELSHRGDELEQLVSERAAQFAGSDDERARAIISLFADHQLTEGEVRLVTGWSHSDFLAMLGRYQDLVRPDDGYYAALGALEPR